MKEELILILLVFTDGFWCVYMKQNELQHNNNNIQHRKILRRREMTSHYSSAYITSDVWIIHYLMNEGKVISIRKKHDMQAIRSMMSLEVC